MNLDPDTVRGFGEEWSSFDHHGQSPQEMRRIFEDYFSVFPWERLPPGAQGFDLGCGTGRWAQFVAPRVGLLHCVDAAAPALEVAKRNLAGFANCEFHLASVDAIPLADASMDFGFSLGVLHHVPDTEAALRSCVGKLKPGAPFLLYLYYSLDNRALWNRAVWRASDVVRQVVSRAPFSVRYVVTQAIAAGVYWPLARVAKRLEERGFDVDSMPLAAYRNRNFYVMRTDALDRFGTRLEQRFSRVEIAEMMERVGLKELVFREAAPYWCALGYRAV